MASKKMEGIALLQAFLESGEDVIPLTVQLGENEVVFQYKPLTWTGKSRCVSAATEYLSGTDAKGGQIVKVVFHMDAYKKACLREMMVNPPVPMTDAILDKLPESIGAQFDAIIPDPFGVADQVAAVKKGSAASPEADAPSQ